MKIKIALATLLAIQGVLAVPAWADATANVTASHPSKVFVDGREAGRTPLHVANLAPGSHEIRVVNLATDELKTFQIVAPARVTAERTVHAAFDASPVYASPVYPSSVEAPIVVTSKAGPAVTVESNTVATIYLDNVHVGQTPLTMMAVLPGFHVLKAVDAYSGAVLTRPFKMEGGRRSDLNLVMEFPRPVIRVMQPAPVHRSIIYVSPSHHSRYGSRSHHDYRSPHSYRRY